MKCHCVPFGVVLAVFIVDGLSVDFWWSVKIIGEWASEDQDGAAMHRNNILFMLKGTYVCVQGLYVGVKSSFNNVIFIAR